MRIEKACFSKRIGSKVGGVERKSSPPSDLTLLLSSLQKHFMLSTSRSPPNQQLYLMPLVLMLLISIIILYIRAPHHWYNGCYAATVWCFGNVAIPMTSAGKILSGENSKGLIFSGASRWRALTRAANGAYSLRIFPTLRKSLRAQFKNPSSGQISNSDTWWIFTKCPTLSALCTLVHRVHWVQMIESDILRALHALHKENSKSDDDHDDHDDHDDDDDKCWENP